MRRVIAPLERLALGSTRSTATHRSMSTARDCAPLPHVPDVPSAQVKSAVLLAGLLADGVTSVIEPAQTRDHTERALEAFGVHREHRSGAPGRCRSPAGSASRAARSRFPAISRPRRSGWWPRRRFPDRASRIDEVGLSPTRTGLLGVLRRFGARVHVEVSGTDAGEPRGTVVVEGDQTRGVAIEPAEVPGLIDELPAIAALARTARGQRARRG